MPSWSAASPYPPLCGLVAMVSNAASWTTVESSDGSASETLAANPAAMPRRSVGMSAAALPQAEQPH